MEARWQTGCLRLTLKPTAILLKRLLTAFRRARKLVIVIVIAMLEKSSGVKKGENGMMPVRLHLEGHLRTLSEQALQ